MLGDFEDGVIRNGALEMLSGGNAFGHVCLGGRHIDKLVRINFDEMFDRGENFELSRVISSQSEIESH